MAKFPSRLALLGLLAVAGYQNREKISEMLSKTRNQSPDNLDGRPERSFLDELNEFFTLDNLSAKATEAIDDVRARFEEQGQEQKAHSWVGAGANESLSRDELETVLGADAIDDLSRRTGMSRDQLLDKLARVLPEAIDDMTPEGRPVAA